MAGETQETPAVPSSRGLSYAVLVCGLILLIALAYEQWLRRHPLLPPRHGVVVTASWFSNGQQMVTFRPEPADADVTYASVASSLDDGSTPPAVLAAPGFVVPKPRSDETNYTLTFVAIPRRGAMMAGKPLAYTPGSYTVAYTPQQPINRIRVGVALPDKGMRDMERRIARAWREKNIGPLFLRSHGEPVFVVTERFTNATAGVTAAPSENR